MRPVGTRATRRHVTRDCRTPGPARHDRANPMLPPNPPDRGPKDQRLPPVLPQAAPTAAERCAGEPASAVRCVRSEAEATNRPRCTTTACTRATGHPSRCSSANDRICPFCSMPRTDRADVAADALGPSSSRFIASSEPYRQAIRSPPGRSEPQPGSGPTRAETRASHWKRSRKEARTTVRHPRAVSPPLDCNISVGTP